jgi:GNAT superfamily N-acetyltransferase
MTQATVPTATTGTIRVIPVSGRADLKRFIDYPYQLYKNHPTWVPPLLLQEWEDLDQSKGKNPYFEHAEAQYFLAMEGDRIVGRIAAMHDKSYNEFHNEAACLFACFEAESAAATKLLLQEVESWGKSRGLSLVKGPSKVAQNDMMGVLVENFDDPPVVMMVYNPPEYKTYLEQAGYVKSEDTFAWRMTVQGGLPDRVARIATRVKERLGVKIRTIALKNLKALEPELPILREIYNAAWDKNWGFVPWTEHEIQHLAAQLQQVADKDLCMIAEIAGRPVAFSVTLPDINESLRGTGGKLLPFGLIKLLLHKPKRMRLVALGILPEYQGRGIDALLYAESFWRGQSKYNSGEFGWTLESNEAINNAMKALGAVAYKRYRIFEKRL